MTNKIFAMNETTITAIDNFFDRMLKSLNIRAKKLIVNKSYLNIEQHFHHMTDETRETKINICDDYDVFETKMKSPKSFSCARWKSTTDVPTTEKSTPFSKARRR